MKDVLNTKLLEACITKNSDIQAIEKLPEQGVNPKMQYDADNILNPLWSFGFLMEQITSQKL